MRTATEARMRLDEAVVARNLAETRARARALVMAGDVLVDGLPVLTAGKPVANGQEITLRERPRFVSRGGEKLAHALDAFSIDPADAICADLGASTGGFTDCLLQAGAQKVYAIDVGHGQLHDRIRTDPRVIVMEKVNARTLSDLPEPVDLVVIDVSFISLALIFPVAAHLLRAGGQCVPLIKPQFEVGKGEVGKGGVVRDHYVHARILHSVLDDAREYGFGVLGLTQSPLTGPAGNIEFLAHLRLGEPYQPIGKLIANLGMGDAPV
jgi:23S rRNA (cytidine1920-2'-O)/16S rRNA (cytidine1409-2'-O)-methyltransferase